MIASAADIRIVLGLASSITDTELAILQMAHKRAESSVAKHLRYNPEHGDRTGELYPLDMGQHRSNPRRWTSNATHAIPDGGYGNDQLVVKHIPIRSITSLRVDEGARSGTIDGSFPITTELEEGVGFHAEYEADGICRSGLITRIGSAWPEEPGTVKITYVSGYTAGELNGDFANAGTVDALPIKTAVIETAAKAFIQLMALQKNPRTGFTTGPITGEKLGDYSYSTDGTLAARFAGLSMDIPTSAQILLAEFVHFGNV